MAKLIASILMFAFILTNSTIVVAATCQHVDATAHYLALSDGDLAVAGAAENEEAAADALEERANLSDAGSVQLAGYILPTRPGVIRPLSSSSIPGRSAVTAGLRSRTISPLLDPPLI